jgi:drug/metabolite transporter (DMT)-like permease
VPKVRRPELTLAAVCSGWGTIPLLIRHVELPASAIAFSRLVIAAAGLAVVTALSDRRTRQRPHLLRPNPKLGGTGERDRDRAAPPRLLSYRPGLCAATAVILAVHWLSLFAAYERADSGTVILIVYLAPVGIAALAPITLGERHTRRTLVALAIAAAGFLLVATPAATSEHTSAAGLALAGFAGATFIALVLASKPVAEAYGGLRSALIEMTGAAIVLAPVAATAGWGRPHKAWLWLLVLGLVHTAVGTALYLEALARTRATNVAILGYLEPAAVVLLGWLFLNESPGISTLAGGALIVAAGWMTVAQTQPAPEVARV